jgi:P27 family predicted phage terminase small subunit
MGRRGPQPKPTTLKIAQGNPGKRALNDNEPVPPPGDIACPAWVEGVAREVWDQLAPVCVAMKTLTTADVLTFARYCDRFARWLELRAFVRDKLQANPFFVRYDEKGKIVYAGEFPQNQELARVGKEMLLLEREFGLTPAARSRLQVGSAPPAVGAATGAGARSAFADKFLQPIPISRGVG